MSQDPIKPMDESGEQARIDAANREREILESERNAKVDPKSLLLTDIPPARVNTQPVTSPEVTEPGQTRETDSKPDGENSAEPNKLTNRRFADTPNNPPTPLHGRVQDNNLTNQDGQPLENSPLTTGFTGVAGDEPNERIRGDRNETGGFNAPPVASDGATEPASMPLMEEKFHAEKDRVSGNTVIVRNKNNDDKIEEWKAMMKRAEDSLGDRQIGEIGLDHAYWNLQEQARKFGKDNGLI